MPRPNYGNSSGSNRQYSSQPPSRPPYQGSGGGSRSSGSDIEPVIRRIKELKQLADLPVEEISKEDGIAEKLAKDRNFRGNLKTTQLRKFFDTIVSNQERLKSGGWDLIESDFHMIRPNLAYAKGRKLIPDDFFHLVSACLEKVNPPGTDDTQRKENYKRFVELMQALVAYIKYYGGQ